jgi:hypothetical protein
VKHKISDIKLPKDSRNSQLEEISKNHFRPLFDVERFILKEEFIDNGIDFRCEIKDDQKILGFGFNFQLKSSESIFRNKDYSYSKNIETSNIEYLLNNGQPAFYGFYIDNEKQFYYKNLKEVISDLNLKDRNWQDQVNHTIRFSEKLNSESVNLIFETAFNDGQMFRKINASIAENFGLIEKQNKIIIDVNQNVMTDNEISSFIENYGLLLTDRCRWKEVIELHQKTTIGKSTKPIYNLVIGISYYYSGEYFKSLDFLKESYKKLDLLDVSLKEYLQFFYFSIQKILGIISLVEFENETKNFDVNESMYVYQKLDDINKIMPEMYTSENYICEEFENKIDELINNSNTSNYLKVLAKIELLHYKSEQLICKLIPLMRSGYLKEIEVNFNKINDDFYSLLNETEEINSLFINRYCLLKHSRFIVHFDCIIRRSRPSDFLNSLLPEILKNIEISVSYFKKINHVENELYALIILLEYYKNLENFEKVTEIINVIEMYKIEYSNPDFNRKINYTMDGGTLVDFIIGEKNNSDAIELEMGKLNLELKKMNEEEKKSKLSNYKDAFTVELFPMGYFQFPKEEVSTFFKILKLEDEKLKSNLMKMFEVVIPILNCYKTTIDKEGSLNGILEYKGIDSIRNAHRIRKEMYENKFYKKELRFN